MPLIEALVGLALIAWVLNDVFNTVVLPRPSPSRFRPASLLTRWGWRVWRPYAEHSGDPAKREGRLGLFGPAVVLLLLGIWIVLLIAGFGLAMHALGGAIQPQLPDLGTAFYFAAISLLTIGYGDFVPVEPLARVIAAAAGGVGLGIVALTITYLFSLYGNFQRREILIITLDARAGAPPSGVVLLETCARYHDSGELRRVFADWERWSAQVLESHLAYPILLFFRSTHDHESWVSAIGAVL
ncbi:MAG TPA: ion channel, partial [Candidatus Saccharimonadales bacterium]|nr:ion channel [Candidatus Saccharimonadales bacterium]